MNFSSPFRIHSAAAAVLVTALVSGCGVSDPKSPKFVVAKGKGVKITRAELDKAESQFFGPRGMNVSQIPKEQLAMLEQQVLQQLVMQDLLLKEADHLKIAGMDEKANSEIERIKTQLGGEEVLKERLQKAGVTLEKMKEDLLKQLRIQEVLRVKAPATAEPSEEAVAAFYAQHKRQFSQPATVKASHVLVQVPPNSTPAVKAEKKKKIDAARAKVAKGADFAAVAKEVSEDPGSAPRGGDLGFFGQGQMVPQFDKVAFSSKIGTLSPVFESPFGYHFLKVTDLKPAGEVPLAEARLQIIGYLKNQQRAQAVEEFIKKLESGAKVTYNIPKAEMPSPAAQLAKPPPNASLPPPPPRPPQPQ